LECDFKASAESCGRVLRPSNEIAGKAEATGTVVCWHSDSARLLYHWSHSPQQQPTAFCNQMSVSNIFRGSYRCAEAGRGPETDGYDCIA